MSRLLILVLILAVPIAVNANYMGENCLDTVCEVCGKGIQVESPRWYIDSGMAITMGCSTPSFYKKRNLCSECSNSWWETLSAADAKWFEVARAGHNEQRKDNERAAILKRIQELSDELVSLKDKLEEDAK